MFFQWLTLNFSSILLIKMKLKKSINHNLESMLTRYLYLVLTVEDLISTWSWANWFPTLIMS